MAQSISAAISSSKCPMKILGIALLVLTINACGTLGCGFTSIIGFGDSVTDTGNDRYIDDGGHLVFNLPYGETYFHHPTGRYSNGRLIIDFIAESLGLPLVPPFLGGGDFKQGVNFAVAGGTALKVSSNYSLDIQLGWFQKLLPSLCNSSSDCDEFFRKSLFLVGEIGGIDYYVALLIQKRSIDVVRPLVPKVINAISTAIRTLISYGAVNMVVPGYIPIGCSVIFLTKMESPHKDDYDPQTGCLNWLNEFSEYHNSLLQKELQRLQTLYPNTTIVYADYYNASMDLYRSPAQYGFTGLTQKACCGGVSLKSSQMCGSPSVHACNDPSTFVSWDGLHLTEAAYRWIVKGFVKGSYIVPPRINISCVPLPQDTSVNSLAII